MRPATIDYEYEIVCVDTEQHRAGLACCYLLRSGDAYAFIDCGTSLSVPGLLDVLRQRGIAREQVAYVIPTHVHLDHAGGAGLMLRELPNAQLVIHPRGARHMRDPSKLINSASVVYGAENMTALYGEILPVPQARVLVADDNFTLDFNGRELLFIDAPGHARHHFAVWDARSRGWFTGDVFGLSYREFDGPQGAFLFPTTTPVQFQPEAWLTTLERLLATHPAWAYLTHYGRVGNIAKLAGDLRRGLADYQRLARAQAQSPQRHAAIKQALMQLALQEVAALQAPVTPAQARELLAFDMELNTQGLEVWLDRK
ncbi:MAG: fold metallo-hydrolase [Nevskia sp.]|nr:fold metallo-hydrolase [Nevskia sp.]